MRALLCLLCACSSPPTDLPTPSDPEAAARAFLTDRVFEEAEQLVPLFKPGVSPADFPLRLMLDGPSQYRFIDLAQQRWIDGRHVVWALAEIEGKPQRFTLWLEKLEDRWLIAGWSKLPEAAQPNRPVTADPARMPLRFATSTFRGAPRIAAVPVEQVRAAAASTARVRVKLKQPIRYEGECPEKALAKALRHLEGALARCYAQSVGEGRGGRLTFALTLDGTNGRREAKLVETTVLDEGLRACGVRALQTVRPAVEPKALCTLRARYVFRTKP